MICLFCFKPRRGWGGEGGTIWDHFKQYLDHVGTVLGPYMPKDYVCQPLNSFIEMAHTNFMSYIRKHHTSPYFELKGNTCFQTIHTFRCFKINFKLITNVFCMYVYYILYTSMYFKFLYVC